MKYLFVSVPYNSLTILIYFSLVSESDCYVILNLPTASARTKRTKTIPNNNNPEWNESFTFQVFSNIKVNQYN